jgi:hypothetical protein
MWTLIDEMRTEESEMGTLKGFPIKTYAKQVGSIGCLVLVVAGAAASSTTFVPGVKLEKKKAPEGTFEDDKWELVVASGYGEIPQPPADFG